MVTKSKERIYAEFSARLKEACRDKGFDPDARGFSRVLGSFVGIGYKGAEKWLDGLSMPDMGHGSALAIELGVGFEWLMTERGPKNLSDLGQVVIENGGSTAMAYDKAESNKLLVKFLNYWPELGEDKQRELVEQADNFVRLVDPAKFKKAPRWKTARRRTRQRSDHA